MPVHGFDRQLQRGQIRTEDFASWPKADFFGQMSIDHFVDKSQNHSKRAMTQNSQGPSLAARCLGFGGLIPFVGLAATLWLVPSASQPLWAAALLGYGATICSFLGAIHWGLTMRDGLSHVLRRCFGA
jgi:hypothetical protein